MRRIFPFILMFLLIFGGASAENDGDCVYTLLDADGKILTRRAAQMYVGDEYIASDNRAYRIAFVDDAACTATAQELSADSDAAFSDGANHAAVQESSAALADGANRATAQEASAKNDGAFADGANRVSVQESSAAFADGANRAKAREASAKDDTAAFSARAEDDKKLICMYSTHSDESYVPSDGASSLWKNAGIYDVGDALKENLEARGITVEYSEDTFLPHDADAYNRSRPTVEEYAKKMPDAIIDIHRDGVAADEYETEVDGDDTSMVRLFVGRSNANAAENKAFAKRLKAAADEKYPGLVKDIYIGKGNYNQELYPSAILLEFGTYEIEKEKAISATEYMAEVIDDVLFGSSAKAETGEKNGAAATGIAWAIGIVLLTAGIYALAATGKFSDAWNKMKRGTSEMSVGLFGKKK